MASLIDPGLVDELGLIVCPLIAGKGKALFGTNKDLVGSNRGSCNSFQMDA